MRLTVVYWIIALLVPSASLAQEQALFERATEAYNQGEYTKALEYYQRILDSGKHSAELYYNMGNAHYKLEDIGESIYYYEKALLLQPNDPEVKNNLRYAENMKIDAIDEIPQTVLQKFYNQIVNHFTYEQWAVLAIVAIILFTLAFCAYYLLNLAVRKRLFFIGGSIFLFLAITSLVFAHLSFTDYQSNNPAIVFSREINVAAEPNQRSEKVFTLHEGTKVNVVEKLNEWSKIQISDGQIGWIPSSHVKLIKDF